MQRTTGLLLKTGAARRERQTSVENGNSGTPSGVALQTHRQSASCRGWGWLPEAPKTSSQPPIAMAPANGSDSSVLRVQRSVDRYRCERALEAHRHPALLSRSCLCCRRSEA